MNKINLSSITENARQSPQGRYRARYQEISMALGRDRDSFDLRQRHPFDLAKITLPSGASMCPYHSHSAQTELYLVISGRGTIRDEFGATEVVAGDAFIYHPGEAHQLSNQASEDFVYYVIADNPVGETCYYPDSRKWAVTNSDDYGIIKGESAGYYDGEE